MSLRSPSEKKRAISYCFWLSFLRTEDLYSSYHSYKLGRIYPPPPTSNCVPNHLFVQIMFVRSRSIASTASCLSRDRRSYRSSLIAEKSRSTLACVAGSAASDWLESRTAVG